MRIAKDSDGYWWRVFDDGTWSMCPTNSDNSAVPQPVTYYVPEAELKVTQQREARLREALSLANSMIHTGEQHSPRSSKLIEGALAETTQESGV